MKRMTEAAALAHNARFRGTAPVPQSKSQQKRIEALAGQTKYRNVKCEADGIAFDSKLEARFWEILKYRKSIGEVLWILRQVPIDCGGGVTYRVDFVFLEKSGRVVFVDPTGRLTQVKKNKLKQIKALHGIDVEITTA